MADLFTDENNGSGDDVKLKDMQNLSGTVHGYGRQCAEERAVTGRNEDTEHLLPRAASHCFSWTVGMDRTIAPCTGSCADARVSYANSLSLTKACLHSCSPNTSTLPPSPQGQAREEQDCVVVMLRCVLK
ncbi:hypothetical protein TREES_T100017068 [Tupaia chinensis]|uniref:Uncharacterized protein n=1 Tax=Tupaia chinensis TaxID=246437 RepID=L9KUU3_TUPCH|nr:hypothetical protein TREES_T100017068 [Tupaia chinensis]